MRRLSQTLAAAGASMCVACSGDPPTSPRLTPQAPVQSADTQLVRMSQIARNYLQQLRAGVRARSLTEAERLERVAHLERFIGSADSLINLVHVRTRAALDEEPETPIESEPPSDPFVESGTFTDLCLECKNATSFVETNVPGILMSLTDAFITVDRAMYNPSSGTLMCVGFYCSSTIDLSGIVDCRAQPASGTASGTANYMWKLKLLLAQGWGKNTWAKDECEPFPPLKVSLSSSDISVGASSQASTSCVSYVQWSSSAPAVATVSDYGVVTGRASGSAEISATCGANRGSATIRVHLAEEEAPSPPPPDACDDPMTPAVEDCDNTATLSYPPYSVTYTRAGSLSDLDPALRTIYQYVPAQSYSIFCDVTDWYEWNTDHTVGTYVGTVVNRCWITPYNGTQH